jgi:protein TonB
MSWQRHAAGVAFMASGTIAVFGGVVLVNALGGAPERDASTEVTKIEVVHVERQKPKTKPDTPPPPPPPQAKAPPPPSIAALGGGLGGISMALPGLDLGSMNAGAASLLGGGEDVVHTSDTVDEAPKPSRQEPMTYPPRLRQKGVEGYVLMSLLVDANGSVTQAKVLESKPAGVFDDVALEGVRAWSFTPGRYKGEAVQTWVEQRIAFELRS